MHPLCLDESRESLTLLFKRGLKSPLSCNKTITMRHNVQRLMFPDMSLDLRAASCILSEEELTRAGLGSSLKKCMTVTGGGYLPHPVVRAQVKFMKSYFTGKNTTFNNNLFFDSMKQQLEISAASAGHLSYQRAIFLHFGKN